MKVKVKCEKCNKTFKGKATDLKNAKALKKTIQRKWIYLLELYRCRKRSLWCRGNKLNEIIATDNNVGNKEGEEMVYRFNKENFNKNASRNVKEKIKYILDEIENKEVEFDENNNGTIKIDWYGVEHELYPVQKSWCIEVDI